MRILDTQDTTHAFDALGLGEVMLRLSPVDTDRIGQGDMFVKRPGGSELNVVSGISLLGKRTGMITKLPQNEIGEFVKNRIRFCGVSDDYIIFDHSPSARQGVYYYEGGAYPRKSTVIYDRRDSSFTTLGADELSEDVYTSTRLFHTSGITLALGGKAQSNALEMLKGFHDAGAVISFDVNYRASLWSESAARECILKVLPYVDILFVSEETSRRMMQKEGTLHDMMASYAQDYDISIVASTERHAISPKIHSFTSTIFDAENSTFHTEAPYENIEVIDRLGSGDAYVAGVLYSLLSGLGVDKAVSIGNAMCAIKNTVPGDLPDSSPKEIQSVIADHTAPGRGSEMNR